MKSSIFRRRFLAAAAMILLLLFLLRPGASRLKSRIAGSIGGAWARQVEIGTVHIRLLPQPGFDLENLVVYDDAAFSAEPMLRAPEVTAVLRLTSLLRGRLEIARLNLTEPSLNLVRRENGRWNLEALLERASLTPLAPTAKSKSEARPGFFYIEASTGRINFKIGQVKKPYALTNADFALWQDSENTWGMRLKAQPLRADLNLSDTGLLQMNGTWQRAGSLRETPLQFSLEWNGPQLGQMSKFFTGSDRGWRGAMRLDATLQGTPAQLQVSSEAAIQDFRRYDIPGGEALRLAAHCDARYSSVDRTLHEVFCSGPVGSGAVTLHGDMGLSGSRIYHLAFSAAHVPVSAVAALARRMKKDVPVDLVATGSVEGKFTVRESGNPAQGAQVDGRGEIADLRLLSTSEQADFAAASVPLLLTSGSFAGKTIAREVHSQTLRSVSVAAAVLGQPRFEFGPFSLALGRPTPSTVQGWINRSGYNVFLTGEGEISHALRLGRLLGLPSLRTTAEGVAQMDLQIAGAWSGWEAATPSGFSLPQITGTTQLKIVRAEVRGVNGPIEISSARLQLTPEGIQVDKLNATAARSHWTGSVALPRGCGTPGACLVRFNLSADDVALGELSHWLNPRPSEKPWYRLLGSSPQTKPPFLAELRASGKVSTSRLVIHDLVVSRVSADLDLNSGKLQIADVRGEFLGGTHRGEWQADFTRKPPVYKGSGTLTDVSMAQLATAMHDGWIAGTASGTYQLTASGLAGSEFWQSAEGTLQFDVRDGTLPHISLVKDAGPLQVERFFGRVKLHDGQIDIKDSKLDSSSGAYEVNGTVSFGRELDVKIIREGDLRPATFLGYNITGTVEEPQVVQVANPETRAQLKP